MFSEEQNNPNQNEENNIYCILPDPFGNSNNNVIKHISNHPERIIDFPDEQKDLLNQPLNGISFQEENDNNNLAQTIMLTHSEIQKKIPHQHPSIIDGIILNCQKLSDSNFNFIPTESQLMGTEQLSQLRSSIMTNQQPSQNEEEFIQVKLLPNITPYEYEQFKNTETQTPIQQIKTNIFNSTYFHSQILADAICFFVDVNNLYKHYYESIFSKKKGISLDSLKQYIYAWRKVRGDGNCFYRAVIIRYIEILILNRKINLLKDFVVNMNKAFQGELKTKLMITKTCTIQTEVIFSIFKAIIEELEINGEANAYCLFLKAMNMKNKHFDYAVVLYFRYLLYTYIKENENKSYLKEFDIKIGNLLPIEFESDNGVFLWDNFYEKYLMKMFSYAEKIIVYITPFVLGINLDILLYEDIADPLKRMKYSLSDRTVLNDSKQTFLNSQRIYVFNINNHYDLIYTKEEFEQVMRFADKQIVYVNLAKIYNNESNRNNGNVNPQVNYNKSQDNVMGRNNVNYNYNNGQFINQNKQPQINQYINQNVMYGNNAHSSQNKNSQTDFRNQNYQNERIPNQNQFRTYNNNINYINNFQYSQQNNQPIQKDGIIYYPSINSLQEKVNVMNSNNNINSGNPTSHQNMGQITSQNYYQPSQNVVNNNNQGRQNYMNNQNNFIPINQIQTNQKEIINELMDFYKHNIDEMKKIQDKIGNLYNQNVKTKVDDYCQVMEKKFKKLQKTYIVNQNYLQEIFKQCKGNICVCCKKDINRINGNQYFSLPCGCSICNLTCLKSYYSMFFTLTQRCSCLEFYVPRFFEELKILLEQNLHCNMCEINDLIKQQFADYCCVCLKRNIKNKFEQKKCYFYHKNCNPQCFERWKAYKVLSEEIQRHRICSSCINPVMISDFFNCSLCKIGHMIKKC